MSKLNGRVERLEGLRAADTGCRACAARPTFGMDGDDGPCRECGAAPLVFTIDIERAGADGDAA